MSAIQPLLARLAFVKEKGLTGHELVASFLCCMVQPLMERESLGFEYTGVDDSSHIKAGVKLTEEELEAQMRDILSSIPCVPVQVEEYHSDNMPPMVSLLFY